MRIEGIEIQEFSGDVTGARSATSEWSARSGMILRVRTPDGLVGQGEASPLPGYSRDAHAPAREVLENIDWASLPEPDSTLQVEELFDRLDRVGSSAAVPSARFAVETAYLDLAGQRGSRPLW